jgi:hypothetical protein
MSLPSPGYQAVVEEHCRCYTADVRCVAFRSLTKSDFLSMYVFDLIPLAWASVNKGAIYMIRQNHLSPVRFPCLSKASKDLLVKEHILCSAMLKSV